MVLRLKEDRLVQSPESALGERQRWLAELYDRLGGRLWAYALAILADRGLAEDAVQQAFVKVSSRIQRGPIASAEGYLLIAVRNEAYRLLRQRKPRQEASAEPWLECLPGSLLDEELRQQVQQALEQLPAEQREVVHLKIWEEQTFQQIAGRLGISINTAASRYRYAQDKLERLLGPYLERD